MFTSSRQSCPLTCKRRMLAHPFKNSVLSEAALARSLSRPAGLRTICSALPTRGVTPFLQCPCSSLASNSRNALDSLLTACLTGCGMLAQRAFFLQRQAVTCCGHGSAAMHVQVLQCQKCVCCCDLLQLATLRHVQLLQGGNMQGGLCQGRATRDIETAEGMR